MRESPDSAIRVTRLVYRLVSEDPTDDFSQAEPLDGRLTGWRFHLENGILDAVPTSAFTSRESAIEDLARHLRGWVQGVFLAPASVRVRFEFERSEVEVANPDPDKVYVFPEPARLTLSMGAPTILVGHRHYPAPDASFHATPLTDLLTERLRALHEGRAELPAVTYVVLSALEQAFGGRKSCAAALAVDPTVLATMGRLSAQFDPKVGRKAVGSPKALTGQELRWMRDASARLVRRVGEHAAGGSLAQITMADMPTL